MYNQIKIRGGPIILRSHVISSYPGKYQDRSIFLVMINNGKGKILHLEVNGKPLTIFQHYLVTLHRIIFCYYYHYIEQMSWGG